MESERARSPLRDEFRTILQGVEQGDPVAIAEYVYYLQPYELVVSSEILDACGMEASGWSSK
jgi:hypothetical protein